MTEPTRPPHLPPLADDYIHRYDKVREFYSGDFRDPAAFVRQVERVRRRQIPREDLAAVLAEQNRGYGCGRETLGAIDKIVRDGACAVVTGQQVGLFSGPLYTVYKALTAVRLSDELSHRGLGSVVPVFWLASDDHDLAEIDHIDLVDRENRLRRIRCLGPPADARVPVSNVPLPPEIGDCLQQLAGSTLDTEFKAEVLAALGQAYAPGRSFVEAFARWMTRLFASRGLILIDAGDPRLKRMGGAVFGREIDDGSPSTRQAAGASERLRRAGYDVQVPLHPGILNLFFIEQGRQAVQWTGGAFRIKGRPSPLSKDDLLALAGERPHLFSPNVLLRPVYQDALLPTVAYVAGPAEIAYFGQMNGVYEAFGLPMPVIYPRKNLTIVEKAVGHILDKHGLTVADIWRDADRIVGDLAGAEVPAPVSAALARVRDTLDRDFAGLKAEALAFEPGLSDPLDQARGKIGRQLSFVEKKLKQAASRRNEITVRQLRKAVDNLFPNRHLQERVFNIVPYLIKYGPGFVDRLDRAIDMAEADHQLFFL